MKHPLHPFVVHFPITCWSLATLGDLTGIVFTNSHTQTIGLLMLIGCISAIAAMAAGLYEMSNVKDSNTISNIIDHHMHAAVVTWSFYSLSLYLRWGEGFYTEPNVWAIVTSVLGFISLIMTGWYGANLVYTHGVGTNKIGPNISVVK